MGSDDLFKKRKLRAAKEKRKKTERKNHDRVLIVCEGEKTEPFYFNGLRSAYKLDTANIKITGDCGSDPMSIVDKAIEEYEKSKQDGNCFDRVYCVFDKDAHPKYQDAINKIKQLSTGKNKKPFFVACSVPCFEYWLLLHFVYTTQPFSASGKNSVADNVIKELKKYIPTYEKGQDDIFVLLKDKLNFAIQNAKKANQESVENNTDNPSTAIVGLVEYLIGLSKIK